MSESTDAELLRAYADEKSEPAFGELVRRHVNLVYSVALRQCGGDAHLAEDVAQRVFTDLARKARQLSGHAVLGGWLYRSAQFAASDVVRAERRRRARESEASAMHENSAPTIRDADWQKLAPVLDQAIGELAAPDRDAVVLRFFAGRPFAEIGATLRVTEDAARMRVERALEKLRAALGRRGITSTTAALGVALANQAAAVAPAGIAASVTGAALAGAAAGGGAGVVFLTFMSTTKVWMGLTTIVALVAIGVAVHEANVARQAEGAAVSNRRERDELRDKAATLRKIPAEPSRTTALTSHPAASPPPAVSATKSVGAEFDYVIANSEARAAYLKRATLSLKSRFEHFFQTAGLTGEQQDRFLKLAMDDAEGRLDALAMRRDAGAFDPGGPTMSHDAIEQVSKLQNQRDTEVTEGLRELLGDKFNSAMEAMNAVHERNVTDKLASQLYDTASPLTAQQAEQMITVLAQNRFQNKTDTAGGAVIPPELSSRRLYLPSSQAMPWTLESLISDAAITRASGVLSPTQIAALKVLQAQQVADLQTLPPVPTRENGRKSK